MLYSSQDYIEVKIARRNVLLQILAASLVFTAVIVICSIIRLSWPGYVAAGLWGLFVIFIWGMKGSKINRYYHFLKDIEEGLENNITVNVERIDSSIITKDLVDFYTMIVREDGSDPESPARKLYIDASKELPSYTKEAHLSISLFGNYIKEIKVI